MGGKSATAEDRPRNALKGRERPRLAPPTPARSSVKDFHQEATSIGVDLYPWQLEAGRYIYALGHGDTWLYPEVAIIVARQAGKTFLLIPHIVRRLRMGRGILHAGQTRELPRDLFKKLAPIVERVWPDAVIRRGAGQEMIEVPSTGGFYKITAATGGAPRGLTIDDLLVDELREIGQDFIDGATPTLSARPNPQIIYLSNAGSEESHALNAIRLRAEDDPYLAWLEWSADPKRAIDDPVGWAEANPSMGHVPTKYAFLERTYQSSKMSGSLAAFETEYLCRWVTSLAQRLVDDADWAACRMRDLPKVMRPTLGVSLDPDGRRASIVMAWQTPQGVALQLMHHVSADDGSVDPDAVGEVLKDLELRHNARVGYDPLTDGPLVRYIRKPHAESIVGGKFTGASTLFSREVSNRRLLWSESDAITDDLTWTAQKPDGIDGSFQAVRAKSDHPITAVLAAVRAVWLAYGPRTSPRPVIR